MTLVATVEYTPETVHLMRSDYAARRARLYKPEPRDVVRLAVADEPQAPIPGERRKAIVALAIKAKPPIVKDAIHDWLCLATPAAMKPSTPGRILAIVAEALGVTRIDLMSERRTADVVLPRQICCWLMRHTTGLSLPEIGRRLGGRDHTTVLASVRKITSLMETDEALRDLVGVLTARIQAEAAA